MILFISTCKTIPRNFNGLLPHLTSFTPATLAIKCNHCDPMPSAHHTPPYSRKAIPARTSLAKRDLIAIRLDRKTAGAVGARPTLVSVPGVEVGVAVVTIWA
jgi:hypothetical protein